VVLYPSDQDDVVLHGWMPEGRRLLYQFRKQLFSVSIPE
jgi:hypothetical protein